MRSLKQSIPTGWAVALAAAALGAAAAAPAAAQPAARDQSEPDVVFKLEREEYQLVWVEDRGAGSRIYSKRVWANGLPVGGGDGGEWELTGPTGAGVAAGQKGAQHHPAIIDGVVIWSEVGPGAADADIYIQRLFGNGRANGRPRQLVARPGDQLYPDIATVSDGYLVVWSENTTDSGDIMGLRLSSALTPRGAPFAVATGASTAEDPTITRDLSDDDSLLVLWSDDRDGNKDIYGTRVLDNGLPRGGVAADFPVIQTPADDYAPAMVVSLNPDRRAGRPQLPGSHASPNARGLLVWTTDHATDGPDVMGQRLFSNGLPLGSSFPVAVGPGMQAWPAVTLQRELGRNHEIEQVEWLAIWVDQSAAMAATLDVFGVEVQLNGISRRPPRGLAAD